MPNGKGKARTTRVRAPRSINGHRSIYAVGTRAGMHIYVPCQFDKAYDQMEFGGNTGLVVYTRQRLDGVNGLYTQLEAHGSQEWTRTVLNHLLPQAKVNELLQQCWGQHRKRHEVAVLVRVVEHVRSRITAAYNDPQDPNHNPTPDGVVLGAVRIRQLHGGHRPIQPRR